MPHERELFEYFRACIFSRISKLFIKLWGKKILFKENSIIQWIRNKSKNKEIPVPFSESDRSCKSLLPVQSPYLHNGSWIYSFCKMLQNLYLKLLIKDLSVLRNISFPLRRFAELMQELKISTVCWTAWYIYHVSLHASNKRIFSSSPSHLENPKEINGWVE